MFNVNGKEALDSFGADSECATFSRARRSEMRKKRGDASALFHHDYGEDGCSFRGMRSSSGG